MLSDGLIESLTDGQIDAVFGHEIGHVRLHHLPFFLLFAFASMGMIGLAGWELQLHLHLSEQMSEAIILSAVIAVWFGAFGFISRRFEAQSDLFGAQVLSNEFDRTGCPHPNCLRHNSKIGQATSDDPICLSGAELFSSALERTASLNAVPRTARSWRHGSIHQRCNFVVRAAEHLPTLMGFQAQITWIKIILVLASAVTAVWGFYEMTRLPGMVR
jgi:STE24 endopeptidase